MIAHSNVSLFLRDVAAEENAPVAQGYSQKVESLQFYYLIASFTALDWLCLEQQIFT
jgi:hypothetical protein